MLLGLAVLMLTAASVPTPPVGPAATASVCQPGNLWAEEVQFAEILLFRTALSAGQGDFADLGPDARCLSPGGPATPVLDCQSDSEGHLASSARQAGPPRARCDIRLSPRLRALLRQREHLPSTRAALLALMNSGECASIHPAPLLDPGHQLAPVALQRAGLPSFHLPVAGLVPADQAARLPDGHHRRVERPPRA